MLIMFGKATVDTKGLPRVAVVNSHRSGDETVLLILLESRTRAAVEKWAARLGVPVVEGDAYKADEREISAEAKCDGNRLRVYTYIPGAPADADPAEFPWRVFAQPEDAARWLVNAFRARELAERFVQRHPDQYGPLTVEDARPVHWAIDGRAACRTGSLSDPMTRLASGATCAACRALIPKEGAP